MGSKTGKLGGLILATVLLLGFAVIYRAWREGGAELLTNLTWVSWVLISLPFVGFVLYVLYLFARLYMNIGPEEVRVVKAAKAMHKAGTNAIDFSSEQSGDRL